MDGFNWSLLILLIPVSVAVTASAVALIWKTGSWVTSVKNTLEQHTIELEKLRTQIEKLETKVEKIYELLTMKAILPPTTQTASPVELNEKGHKIADKIAAQSLAERYAKRIQADSVGKNSYQIQELCFRYARDYILSDLEAHEADRFNLVMECAYEEGVDTWSVMRIIGVLMRDILLQHAGHSHQSVDDPTRQTSAP